MTPLQDQVLILPNEKEQKAGMFFLADSAQEFDNTGRVVNVGPGRIARDGTTIVQMNVTEGDDVMFIEKTGVEVMHNGKRHLLVAETNIIAIL